MRSIADLCYNIPNQPIYGEFTNHSIKTVTNIINDYDSVRGLIVDLGSGSCVTLVTMVDLLGAAGGIGFEVSDIRHQLAQAILARRIGTAAHVTSTRMDIMDMKALPSATELVFCFDKAFTPELLSHISLLLETSSTLKYVISTRRKAFDTQKWRLLCKSRANTKGGQQTFTLYIFRPRDLF